MPATSNDNGRSLEALIVERLASDRAYQLTDRAISAQSRDSRSLATINRSLRTSFEESAEKISNWLHTELSGSSIQVDRSGDSDSGVADIILSSSNKSLGYSIKHNSDSLSHLRPYSIVQKIGQPLKSKLDVDHRARMSSISDRFRRAAGREIAYLNVPHAKQHLYVDVCVETQKTLEKAGEVSGQLFESIVGTNFKKIIVRTNSVTKTLQSIQVYDYSTVRTPGSMRTSILESDGSCRLIIEFDNGWEIALRVHTASSTISTSGQLSLKFDALATKNTLNAPILIHQ